MMSKPRVVCVLGMHRSGTSLIMRILNLLGVYLGSPEHIMMPQADNPRGFWEHRLLEDLNIEILSRLGGSWDEPPTLSAGWEAAPNLADLRRRAEAVLQQDFAGADLWGWKDPRTCLTLPFWQSLLPPMRYVLCLRNPVDVAQSLIQRNGFSFEKSVDLWLTHTRSALVNTAGHERLFIFYEDVMESWPEEVRRLAAFLGTPELSARADIQGAIRKAIKADSQHHRTPLVVTASEPLLAFRAKALYLVLRLCVVRDRGEAREQGELDPTLQAALDHFGRSVVDARSDLAEQLSERDRTVELLKAQFTQQEVKFQSQRARQQQELAQLKAELEQTRRELETLRRELETLHRSKSWALTAPLRQLASVLRTLRAGRPSGSRGLAGLREAWYRIAWNCLPLRTLTPVTDLETPPDASRLTYRFTMPPRAIFRSCVTPGPGTRGAQSAAVELTVSARSQQSGHAIERTWRIPPTLPSQHRRPIECRVDLRRLADQPVELTCRTSVPAGASPDSSLAAWGQPVILSRKPARDIGALAVGYLKLYGLRGALHRARISVGSSASPASRATRSSRAADAGPLPAPSGSPSAAFAEQLAADKLRSFLSDPHAMMVFPPFPAPLVSIVIPTYNKVDALYQCLESVLAYTEIPFELIIVDDCSADATPELLRKLRHVKHLRNESNLDFIRTCNNGARLAKGRYLLFLNNDVTVKPGWLSTLVATMEEYPRCGAVHGKLVRPGGTLQEAGAIVWRDGSALGYGRDDDPLKPEYCYLREVDYGSAACLLVRAELFHGLGGFDERYLPAYYEDADLCFGVRRSGFKVVFQPRVSVVHAEFGSGSFGRAEALCQANQPRFVEKWARELQARHPDGEILRGRDLRAGTRLLVMDDQIPAPYLGSGFPRTYRMLDLLAELGYIVTFVPLAVPTPHQPATDRLQQKGIEVFYGSSFTPRDLLRERAGYYDLVVISRPHNGAKFLIPARQHFPRARIVYDAEALFCVRDFRLAELKGRPLTGRQQERMLRRELDIMKGADLVMTASAAERDLIIGHRGHTNVLVWGHAQDVEPSSTPFSQRKDLLFVGGFLDGHPPNVDAVHHFATTLFPEIRRKLPDCRFVVVGPRPPASIQALASADIVVTGYVQDLKPYYEACRIFVVPLRFGAGISLKLLEAMSHGIPAVVSTVGATGLDLEDGREALIARSDDEFLDKVVRLYEDEALWSSLQRAAQDYVRQRCSTAVMRRALADALAPPE